jgi:AraC family transcriptional regulator
MEPQLIERGEMVLVGMVYYGDPFKSAGGWSQENEIGKLWQRFEAYWEKHDDAFQHVVNPKVAYELHIGTDEFAETKEYYVMAGVQVSEIKSPPLPTFVKVLPPTQYAVFTLRGDEIRSNWHAAIYDEWLPGSGYREAFEVTIERYDGDRFKGADDPESELDILVPIVAKDTR